MSDTGRATQNTGLATGSTTGNTGLWKRILEVVIPGGILTALLYYLGWAFTKAQYQRMGVDHSSLGYAIPDYVLRSVDVIVEPLLDIFLLALAAAALIALIMIVALRLSTKHARFFLVAMGVAGLLGLTLSWNVNLMNQTIGRLPLGIDGAFDEVQSELLSVFSLLAVLTVAYLIGTRREILGIARMPRNLTQHEMKWWRNAAIVLAATLVVGSLFELTRKYADSAGVARAGMILEEPDFRPEIVIFSPMGLGLEHVGAHVESLSTAQPETTLLHRYSGLRLFAEANGRLLVWSCDTNPRAAGIALVPVQEGMWFAVRAPRRPQEVDEKPVYCESNLQTIRDLYARGEYVDVVAEAEKISRSRSGTPFAENATVYAVVARLHLGVDESVELEIADYLTLAKEHAYLANSSRDVLLEGLEMVGG